MHYLSIHYPSQCRLNSSPQANFYKTFSRPIAKVLILAVFTYQVAYWTWTKREADEACAKIDGKLYSYPVITKSKKNMAAALGVALTGLNY